MIYELYELSEDLMGINLPSWLRNTNIALVLQFYVYFFVVWIFIRNHCLLVLTMYCISIQKMPYPISIWFVITKTALVVCSVSEEPSPFDNLILSPLSYELGTCLIVSIGSLAMFFTEHPPSGVYIFICINVCAFTMLDSIFKLTCIIGILP